MVIERFDFPGATQHATEQLHFFQRRRPHQSSERPEQQPASRTNEKEAFQKAPLSRTAMLC
jgi:hypothetical protein